MNEGKSLLVKELYQVSVNGVKRTVEAYLPTSALRDVMVREGMSIATAAEVIHIAYSKTHRFFIIELSKDHRYVMYDGRDEI